MVLFKSSLRLQFIENTAFQRNVNQGKESEMCDGYGIDSVLKDKEIEWRCSITI